MYDIKRKRNVSQEFTYLCQLGIGSGSRCSHPDEDRENQDDTK